jgi:acyl-CoA thioesterase-1
MALFAAAAGAGQHEIRILVLGDSLTSGYGLAAADAFPSRLEARLRALGHGVRVINGGVSGDTSAGGRSRLDWALNDRPDIVIVELGANDALRGLDPAITYANLDAILTRLAVAGIPTLLTGMVAPRNMGRAYRAEFDAVFPALAKKYNVALYPFFLEGVAMRRGLNQLDGMHPNPKGVAEIVDRITPYVVRLLQTTQ